MKRISLSFIIASISICLFDFRLSTAQEKRIQPIPRQFQEGYLSISKEDGLSYIDFLSCDELEGRETVGHGLRISGKYITSLYRLWKISPAGDTSEKGRSYEQRIRVDVFLNGPNSQIGVKKDAETKRFFYGLDVLRGSLQTPGVIEAPVAFAGYGIHAPDLAYDDFAGLELEGKIVHVFVGVPGAENKASPFAKTENRNKYERLSQKIEEIRKREAAALLLISPGEIPGQVHNEYIEGNRILAPKISLGVPALQTGESLPVFVVTENILNYLLKGTNMDWKALKDVIDTSLKPHSMDFSKSTMAIQTEGELKAGITANILGMIEGSDQKLKEEAVLVCGHLDHIGITEDRHVFNGANDNASGSTAVLEIGQAFAINPIKPRRTIIFAHWTGEEKGLLGSRFFTKFPTFPLKNIVACLNLDMIGREFSPESLEVWKRRFGTAEGLEAIKADDFKRLVILSVSYESPEIREIVRSTALTLDLVLATRTCTMDDGGDERNFYFHEIPSVLFSSAIPKEYHTPDDTIDKINGKTFEQITRLAYLVASEIANRDTRLFWEKKTDFSSSPARESRITEKRIRGLD